MIAGAVATLAALRVASRGRNIVARACLGDAPLACTNLAPHRIELTLVVLEALHLLVHDAGLLLHVADGAQGVPALLCPRPNLGL